MKIKFSYKNDTPSFEKNIANVKGWDTPIIELKIEGNNSRSRQAALNDYIITMIYAFRDLINKHETDIDNFEFSGAMVGQVHNINGFEEYSQTSSFDYVVFTLYKDFFNEQLYFTRNADILEAGGIIKDGNKLNTKVIDSSGRGRKDSKRFIMSLITAISYYFPDYTLDYDEKEKKLHYLYKGVPLESIEDIKEDDIFLFFKLVEVLLARGDHTGIYFLDCEFLSAPVIQAVAAFVNLYYLHYRVIFLYNVPSYKKKELCDLTREVITLPNHKRVNNNAKK